MTERPGTAVVIGATGGIGSALLARLRAEDRFESVLGASRRPPADDPLSLTLDLENEASIAAAAARLQSHPPLDLVIVATGVLHGSGLRPEKSYRALDPTALARVFAINTIGPALVAKHLLPLMARDGRSVFAALSARVGSISDNRLGGWHAYRASKAALNMMIRNLAIEQARTRPHSICVALHPGTVDTGLSDPFQKGVPTERLFTPDQSAACLLEVIAGLGPQDSGGFFAWDGSAIPF
ncbi:SDR family NAD(P)-dependent oxidoreductase [Phenylobacterium aquaticum]|uniref:SDR family NAD(P)-dependent oxidoreductase n=1 Tax=Phenylobacterium aquaticum TaxID=1763816 RepID=UPI001F5D6EEE|nr:SDR family NAD(P)-dependent oxidoreductase [Phenylobacterium aquaticum]MCI3132657.1 SDR family NAD(P)-dependent oxidoreductase [Phenylobacterium aquaticum]